MKPKFKLLMNSFAIIAFSLACTSPLYAQNSKQLYQNALIKEEGEGLLKEAIAIYELVVEDSNAKRLLRAKALLQIGGCYEKMGMKQAIKSYEKILEQFGDQAPIVAIAYERIQKRTNQSVVHKLKTSFKPTQTQILLKKIEYWKNEKYTYYDFSPDGKKFVYMDRSEPDHTFRLFAADISGNPVNFLIEQSEYFYEGNPRYSPDGKLIAFTGSIKNEDAGGEDYSVAIYIVNSDGGKPTQIGKKIHRYDTRGGLIWHPSGRYISYIKPSLGIVTIDMNGIFTDTISLNRYDNTRLTGYSPDGKWISYYSSPNEELASGLKNHEFDCYLVSTDSDIHIQLTQTKGYDGYGTWSDKDYSFYFVSETKEGRNIFKIKIDPDTGEKVGVPEQITFFYNANISSPKYINGKSTLTYVLSKEIWGILIPEKKGSDNFKKIASGKLPTLSPDGIIAYYFGVGENNQGIYAVNRLGGVKKKLIDLEPISDNFPSNCKYLSPDGKTIAFFTKKNEEKIELCFLSTENGKLYKSINIDYIGIVLPVWSPDSKEVAYAYNGGLYTVPAWRSKPEKLTKIGEWEPWSITWSPDGKYIAGLESRGPGKNDIMIVSVHDGVIKRLNTKEEESYKYGLEWHPGSEKLAYKLTYSSKNSIAGLREAYADGRSTTLLINQPIIKEIFGKWDPTGENYYFNGLSYGKRKLYKYNSTSKKITVFSNIEGVYLPFWSKYDNFMIINNRTVEEQLWMMKALD
jgi:Tol biopolymer transport system component